MTPLGNNSVPLTALAIHERMNRNELGDLSHAEICFVLTFDFCSDVSNGGLSQFFLNTRNKYTSDVLYALRETGFALSAQLLSTAYDTVDFPEDLAEKAMEWDSADEFFLQYRRLFEALELQWWQSKESGEFVDRLEQYLEAHQAEFRSLRYESGSG